MFSRQRPTFGLILAAASAVLLAGCSTTGTPAPGAPGPGTVAQSQDPVTTGPAGGPAGRFRVTSVSDPELLTAASVTIEFADGQISVDGGCNQLFGALTIAGSTLSSPKMGMTTAACDNALMAQDEWLSDFFNEPVGYQLDGDTLTLTQGDVTLVLAAARVADLPLTGTLWTLTRLNNAGSATAVPDGVKASLLIRDEEAVVEAGCNLVTGRATLTKSQLTLKMSGITEMDCPPEVMAVEKQVLTVFGTTADYRINGSELTLTSGQTGLVFAGGGDPTLPQEDTTDPSPTGTIAPAEPTSAPDPATAPDTAPPDTSATVPTTGSQPEALTLTDRSWTLTGIVDGGTPGPVPGNVRATIVVEDGQIAINAQCNSIGGTAQVADSTLTVSDIVMTMIACDGDPGVVENAMLKVFRSADNTANVLDYVIVGKTLTITGDGGGLVFTTGKPGEGAGVGPDRSTQPLPTL